MDKLNESEKLLTQVYRSAALGSASVSQLLPAAKNKHLSQELKRQKEGYHSIADTAEVYLGMTGRERPMRSLAQEALGIGTRLGLATWGNSPERIANMRMRNSASCADTVRAKAERYLESESHAKQLADRLIRFEEQNIGRLTQM